MRNNEIQQALNATLSSLHVSERDAGMLLAQAKGGKKARRKLSAALVLVIIIVFGMATALAVAFGWKDAVHYLKKERSQGSFQSWTASDQIKLVDSLVEGGYITESDTVRQIRDQSTSEETRAKLAQRIMMKWLDRPEDQVVFQTMMEKIWGDFRTWSLEQKAWLTAVQMEADILEPDHEKYSLPKADDITAETAKRLACTFASVWAGIPVDALSHYALYSEFVTFPKARETNGQTLYTTEGATPVWLIEMENMADNSYPHSIYVQIDPLNGQADISSFILMQQHLSYGTANWPEIASKSDEAMKRQGYRPMMMWSLEARAEWSSYIKPFVPQNEAADLITRAFSCFQYGLPDQNSMKQEEALLLANETLLHRLPNEEKALLSEYDLIYCYFDVTDVHVPKWRIHYSATGKTADEITEHRPQMLKHYRVEFDAYTKELLSFESYEQESVYGYDAIVKQL